MRRMNVREFKHGFHRVEEPIEVLRRTTTIGLYYPTGFGPKGMVSSDDDQAAIHYVEKSPPVDDETLAKWRERGLIGPREPGLVLGGVAGNKPPPAPPVKKG